MPRARNLIAFAGLLVVGGCFVVFWNRPTHGYGYTRDASPVYGLPEDASDIDFYDYGYMPNTAFSFQTTEANFNTWSRTFGGILLISDRSGSIFYIEPTGEGHAVSTGDGIEYGWTEEDRGQHTLYDRPSGRAYYWSHTR